MRRIATMGGGTRTGLRDDLFEEMLAWLQLARCEGVGAITFAALLERYGTVTAALKAARQQSLPSSGALRRIPERAELAAELQALAALDGRVLLKARPDYPHLLRSVPDAPPVIT